MGGQVYPDNYVSQTLILAVCVALFAAFHCAEIKGSDPNMRIERRSGNLQ
jgi:hypothetical protein